MADEPEGLATTHTLDPRRAGPSLPQRGAGHRSVVNLASTRRTPWRLQRAATSAPIGPSSQSLEAEQHGTRWLSSPSMWNGLPTGELRRSITMTITISVSRVSGLIVFRVKIGPHLPKMAATNVPLMGGTPATPRNAQQDDGSSSENCTGERSAADR